MNDERDTVPLRTEDGSGHGHKRRLLIYTDDNFLACAGWGCCVLVNPAVTLCGRRPVCHAPAQILFGPLTPSRSPRHASRVCEQGAFMFLALFVALALPSLQEQWQWLEDECYIVASSCTGESKGRCYVRVALSSGPVCSAEVCIKRNSSVYYTASDNQHEAKRCA